MLERRINKEREKRGDEGRGGREGRERGGVGRG